MKMAPEKERELQMATPWRVRTPKLAPENNMQHQPGRQN
jgi:hypothetical protein